VWRTTSVRRQPFRVPSDRGIHSLVLYIFNRKHYYVGTNLETLPYVRRPIYELSRESVVPHLYIYRYVRGESSDEAKTYERNLRVFAETLGRRNHTRDSHTLPPSCEW